MGFVALVEIIFLPILSKILIVARSEISCLVCNLILDVAGLGYKDIPETALSWRDKLFSWLNLTT